MLTGSSLRYQVYSVDVTDYGGVKGSQGLRTQCSIYRVLGHKQVHGGRLIRIEAEQPTDALGGLALFAECMPDDATRRRGMLISSERQATQARRGISPVLNFSRLTWLCLFLEW
jgi:hypothetical protein